jgi:hypothetical protein
LVKAAQEGGRAIFGLELNSMGGKLVEAIKLAALVRSAKIATAVHAGEECASACFIVFAAGAERLAHHGAWIGVHGAADPSGEETVQSGAATVLMARAVRELGVPTDIIGKMVVTPPDEIVWLTPDELRSMDVTMVGKPVLPPHPQVARSPLPIGPSGGGTPPVDWKEVIDAASAASARQNNGKPLHMRHCDPQTNRCWYIVWVKAQDERGDMYVKSLIDMSGKTLRREFCTFAAPGDARVCVDWDTKAATRAVKDRHGKWVEVTDDLLPPGW